MNIAVKIAYLYGSLLPPVKVSKQRSDSLLIRLPLKQQQQESWLHVTPAPSTSRQLSMNYRT